MLTRVTGTFEARLAPPQGDQGPEVGAIGRMSIDKEFHGELEATSSGQLLAVTTEVEGSAGYVALERVAGILQGRRGSFALQHAGTMNRGAPTLIITVVPDSGTGELIGLAGVMSIDVVDGEHTYAFEYALPS